MPILSSAKKALRSSVKKTQVNKMVKSKLKTALDKTKTSTEPSILSDAFSKIDKAVRRHILHRNKAARLKSQLSKKAATITKAK